MRHRTARRYNRLRNAFFRIETPWIFAGADISWAGAGLSVFPCFVGDSDPRLVRIAQPISELETEQWVVTHHEERHRPEARRTAEGVAQVLRQQAPLFRGELRQP